MKKILLILAMALIGLAGGCGSEFAGGAAAGAAATGALTGISQVYQQRQIELEERFTAAQAEFSAAVTEAEKQSAQAKLVNAQKELTENQAKQAAVELGKQASQTDWSDPAAVSNFSTTAAVLLVGWYLKRKAEKKDG